MSAIATSTSPQGTAPSTIAAGAKAGSVTKGSLSSLTNNFNDFLTLLMTQLKNQDPTSPMDTNQFTSQLVQFSSVEQQINTNSSLTKLIQATQGGNLLQASALVGQGVTVSSDKLSLQNGTAALSFAGTQPVTVDVYNSAGVKLREAAVAAGQTGWTWDGQDDRGRAVPDGAYTVSVKGADGVSVPFSVLGKVTGAQQAGGAMTLKLGSLPVDLGAVQSVYGR